MLEKKVEDYLVRMVKACGGLADKTSSPSGRGFFDRIILMPGGQVCFCEVKKPKGSRVSKHQMVRHDAYRALGADVAIVRTFEEVDRLLDRLIAASVER